MQIEQFIETLFPTQDIKKIKAVQEAKKEEEQQDSSADFWDALILVGSVFLTLLLVSAAMVCDCLEITPLLPSHC